ncbi:MAG: diaminopimelate decarboxylase [Paludibacteraceae bacterium]|jgi:diaminopimelate decarboxylase|nr:diaminopimelate decarboxylase [Paludibacteraceae bacterium]MDI9537215.1 diaminopimelate decarboxylase [Bacteroidota bacterium]HHT61361.1 diaminopimelate decarboxylase [Bacteroidales bacterium]MBP9039038.1 diaminopimelate decarboxylase [Paludibacteraceae bacterium]HOH70780.1 diaminopimelate decarboxylase [Paludibacteraceae bacterium]
MIKGTFPIDKFDGLRTPFYYYDCDVIRKTVEELRRWSQQPIYHIHYAVKANANNRILKFLSSKGLGADCVSGGEIEAAINAGFKPSEIVFAGVGKADWEIELALEKGIFCFNVESLPELEVINTLAAKHNKKAPVAIRVNPDVDAHTHSYITTGLKENKFGFNLSQIDEAIAFIQQSENLQLIGLHFHIGSQITDMTVFQHLCISINEIQESLAQKGVTVEHINVGGGLGINYHHPNHIPIADFEGYFKVFGLYLKLRPEQQVHFELGRAVVAQCGSLITEVLYVKQGETKRFVITDAGMTELIRPALYDAYHHIENISSEAEIELYDVAGPICESSDVFGKDVLLNRTNRGDKLAIRSAGAYGEVMASRYNLRQLPYAVFSDDL